MRKMGKDWDTGPEFAQQAWRANAGVRPRTIWDRCWPMALVRGGKRAKISAPKLASRHSDRGRFHGSDHTIKGGDLDRDLAALRTERPRG